MDGERSTARRRSDTPARKTCLLVKSDARAVHLLSRSQPSILPRLPFDRSSVPTSAPVPKQASAEGPSPWTWTATCGWAPSPGSALRDSGFREGIRRENRATRAPSKAGSDSPARAVEIPRLLPPIRSKPRPVRSSRALVEPRKSGRYASPIPLQAALISASTLLHVNTALGSKDTSPRKRQGWTLLDVGYR